MTCCFTVQCVANALCMDDLDRHVRVDAAETHAASSASGGGAAAAPPPGHRLPGGAPSPQPAPVVDIIADLPFLLQQLQLALAPAAAASFRYYRNMAFAAAVCEERSDDVAAQNALADAAQYAAASQALRNLVARQSSPTSAATLASLIARAHRAVPALDAAWGAAKTAKNYSKGGELQVLR